MTHNTQNDLRLVQFLQTHAASPPPAAPDLEQQIMAAIRAEPVQQIPQSVWHRRVLWVPMAMAAGLIGVWISVQGIMAPEPSLTMAEQAELESFLESTWSEVIEESEPVDLINL